MKTKLTAALLSGFPAYLREDEKSKATIEKYTRDAAAFSLWLNNRPLSKDEALLWKAGLAEQYAPATVNAKIAALNRFFLYCGRSDCRIKPLRIQRRVFRRSDRELTRREYLQLVETAQQKGSAQTALLMETICATGIRVSELRYITVEAVRRGEACIALKGKIRVVLLPKKLSRKLLRFAQKKKITSGAIFRAANGECLSRKRVWADMKAASRMAGIASSKVFPHNLRHLFAVTYYNKCHDISKLADVLGHSCVETTRIYLISSGKEHALYLEQLRLVV